MIVSNRPLWPLLCCAIVGIALAGEPDVTLATDLENEFDGTEIEIDTTVPKNAAKITTDKDWLKAEETDSVKASPSNAGTISKEKPLGYEKTTAADEEKEVDQKRAPKPSAEVIAAASEKATSPLSSTILHANSELLSSPSAKSSKSDVDGPSTPSEKIAVTSISPVKITNSPKPDGGDVSTPSVSAARIFSSSAALSTGSSSDVTTVVNEKTTGNATSDSKFAATDVTKGTPKPEELGASTPKVISNAPTTAVDSSTSPKAAAVTTEPKKSSKSVETTTPAPPPPSTSTKATTTKPMPDNNDDTGLEHDDHDQVDAPPAAKPKDDVPQLPPLADDDSGEDTPPIKTHEHDHHVMPGMDMDDKDDKEDDKIDAPFKPVSIDDDDGGNTRFFVFLVIAVVVVLLIYMAYINRAKVMAIIVEGWSGRGGTSRGRTSSAGSRNGYQYQPLATRPASGDHARRPLNGDDGDDEDDDTQIVMSAPLGSSSGSGGRRSPAVGNQDAVIVVDKQTLQAVKNYVY